MLDHRIKSEMAENSGLHGGRREAEYRLVRTKHGARMRLEGQHTGRNTGSFSGPCGLCQHRLMTPVDAIEIADRHDPALELLGEPENIVKPLHH